MDAPTPSWIAQESVATGLGVSIHDVRLARKTVLFEGVEWRRDGNRVFYSQDGIDRIRQFLGIVPEASKMPQDVSAVATTPPEPEPQPEASPCLKVHVVSKVRDFNGRRLHFANPAVIRCEVVDQPGQLLWVRVRLSTNYAPRLRNGDPMELEVTRIEGHWHHLGRAPRQPGKW